MMRINVITVCNQAYLRCAINFLRSAQKFLPGINRCVICTFNVEHTQLPDIEIKAIPKCCPHAWDIHKFFYKAFAVHYGMKLGEAFIYGDSRECFRRHAQPLIDVLQQRKTIHIQYPRIDFFWNQRWTTTKCFQKLNCAEERYRKSHQYMAGLQAYLPTAENRQFISEYYQAMLDPEIAGPNNIQINPDQNSVCRAHRNDQSVYSLLIEKHQRHQPFDKKFFALYGDKETLVTYAPKFIDHQTSPIVVSRWDGKEFLLPQDKYKV